MMKMIRRKQTNSKMCIISNGFEENGRWHPAMKYSISTIGIVHFMYSYCFQLSISSSLRRI